MQALDRVAKVETRYGGRYVAGDRRRRGQLSASATGSTSSTASRPIAARPSTGCTLATSSGGTTARWTTRRRTCRSSSALSRSRSSTATTASVGSGGRRVDGARRRASRGACTAASSPRAPTGARTCFELVGGAGARSRAGGERRPAVPVELDFAATPALLARPRPSATDTRCREHRLPAAALLAALAPPRCSPTAWSRWRRCVVLLLVCLRAPAGAGGLYLVGALFSALAVFVLTPFVSSIGCARRSGAGRRCRCSGSSTSRARSCASALFQGAAAGGGRRSPSRPTRCCSTTTVSSVGAVARRSVLAVALATRLVPTLERDALGLVEALRGRGVAVAGARGRARLLAPLAGRLARAGAQSRRGDGGARVRPARARRGCRGPAGARSTGAALVVGAVVVAMGVLWL